MATVTACSTLVYTNFSLDEAARRIARRGFRRIEIAHMGSYGAHYRVGREDPKRVKDLLDELELKAIGVNYSTSILENGKFRPPDLSDSEDAEQVESTVQHLIRDLAYIGAGVLCIPIGRRTESPKRRAMLEASAKVIDRLGDYAGEHGIRMVMEVPHCWDLHNNLDRVGELFSLLRSENIGALVDSSHWTVLKYDLEQWYEVVGGRLWHVHLRDAKGDDRPDFSQKLEYTAGRGECDFAEFGDWLDRHEYAGDVSLEFEYRGPQYTMDEVEAECDFGLEALGKMGWSIQARPQPAGPAG